MYISISELPECHQRLAHFILRIRCWCLPYITGRETFVRLHIRVMVVYLVFQYPRCINTGNNGHSPYWCHIKKCSFFSTIST